jgi:hypothetical protein
MQWKCNGPIPIGSQSSSQSAGIHAQAGVELAPPLRVYFASEFRNNPISTTPLKPSIVTHQRASRAVGTTKGTAPQNPVSYLGRYRKKIYLSAISKPVWK